MMKITLKCHKHPGYNPMRSGPEKIKGNCDLCLAMYRLSYEVQRLKRLPPKRYWGGLGDFNLPLLTLLATTRGCSPRPFPKAAETDPGTLFDNPAS